VPVSSLGATGSVSAGLVAVHAQLMLAASVIAQASATPVGLRNWTRPSV
jgi:hypothetical protein